MYSYFAMTIAIIGVCVGIHFVMEPTTEFELKEIEIESIPLTDDEMEFKLNAGVAEVLNFKLNKEDILMYKEYYKQEVLAKAESKPDAWKIRCTGYCDHGYTKSGEWTRDGIIAGKEEWLGRTANLYAVKSDGSIGTLIGEYQFLDTGYGINGSLVNGTSVDVWHATEDEVWDWASTYGDYVYIEFL